VLKIVLAINLVMFFTEFGFGVLARSTALKADSLDMLGDATVYAFSLYVVARSARSKAKVALLKGAIMIAFGLGILAEAIHKIGSDSVPFSQTMGAIGALALFANSICLWLLLKHRNDDLNMRSTWICSRNDIIANTSVLFAALLVYGTQSKWPDIFVGAGISLLFLRSGLSVFREAKDGLTLKEAEST
jgi:cation diffusion facilitator family transporter